MCSCYTVREPLQMWKKVTKRSRKRKKVAFSPSTSFSPSSSPFWILLYMHIIYRYTTDIFVLNATIFVVHTRTHTIFSFLFFRSRALRIVFADFIIIIVIMYDYCVLILFGVRVSVSGDGRWACVGAPFFLRRWWPWHSLRRKRYLCAVNSFETMLVYGWLVSINLNQLNTESSEKKAISEGMGAVAYSPDETGGAAPPATLAPQHTFHTLPMSF